MSYLLDVLMHGNEKIVWMEKERSEIRAVQGQPLGLVGYKK